MNDDDIKDKLNLMKWKKNDNLDLKLNNKPYMNSTHTSFNKRTHNRSDTGKNSNNIDVKFYKNIGGLQETESSVGPSVNNLKQNTAISMKYTKTDPHFETTSSNNFYPSLFTTTSTKPFRKTFINSNNTRSSKGFDKYHHIEDDDINNLISIYHMNENIRNDDGYKKPFVDKDIKEMILRKFKIKKDLTKDERDIIDSILSNKKGNKFETVIEQFNKTNFTSYPNFFNNAYKSLNKLKMNGQIFTNLMNIRTVKQIETYRDYYEKEMNKFIKIKTMPRVRETKRDKLYSNKMSKKDENLDEATKLGAIKKNEVDNKEIQKEAETVNDKNKKFESLDISNFVLKSKLSRDQLLKNPCFYITYESSSYRPTPRTYFAATLDGDTLYVHGGINSEKLSDIWYCNLKQSLKWTQLPLREENSPLARAGHTAVLYKKEIYIYGGNCVKNIYKVREDMLIFSPLTKSFYPDVVYNKNNAVWRRNHIAVTVGNHMFVNGGIDENEKCLSDSVIYDFIKSCWHVVDCKGSKPGPLAFHSAALVMDSFRMGLSGLNIYKTPQDLTANKNLVNEVKYEGIYVFGGTDESKIPNNELRILRIGRKPTEWIIPKINGIPPIGRIMASINFYQDLNILIIHGGRNDKEKINIFNDTFVLDLKNFNWVRAKYHGAEPIERTDHHGILHGDKLYILGGTNTKTYNKFQFCIFHLDIYNSKNSDESDSYNKDNFDIYLKSMNNTNEDDDKEEIHSVNKKGKGGYRSLNSISKTKNNNYNEKNKLIINKKISLDEESKLERAPSSPLTKLMNNKNIFKNANNIIIEENV